MIYVMLFLCSLWLGIFQIKTSTKLPFLVTYFMIAFVGSSRWFVGSDFGQYIRNYHMYKKVSVLNVDESILLLEPMEILIAKLSYNICDHPSMYFGIYFSLTTWLFFSSFKIYNKNYIEPIFLYFTLNIMFFSFDAIRQALASSIFTYFLLKGYEKGNLKERLFIGSLLAFFSHTSILFMIILTIFISYEEIIAKLIDKRWKIFLILIFSYLVARSNVLITILFKMLKVNPPLGKTYYYREIHPLRVVFNMWPVLLVLLQRKRKKTCQSWQAKFEFLMVFYSSLSIASMNSPYIYRLLGYFEVLFMVFLPNYFNDNFKKPTKFFFYTVFFVYWILTIINYSTYKYNLTPVFKQ